METLLHNGFSCGSDPHPLGGFGPAVGAQNFFQEFHLDPLGWWRRASGESRRLCLSLLSTFSGCQQRFYLRVCLGVAARYAADPASTHPGCSAPPWRFAANAPLLCYRKETHCVDTLASDPCFKVQMVAVRVSCRTHIANHFALLYLLAGCHTNG